MQGRKFDYDTKGHSGISFSYLDLYEDQLRENKRAYDSFKEEEMKSDCELE